MVENNFSGHFSSSFPEGDFWMIEEIKRTTYGSQVYSGVMEGRDKDTAMLSLSFCHLSSTARTWGSFESWSLSFVGTPNWDVFLGAQRALLIPLFRIEK